MLHLTIFKHVMYSDRCALVVALQGVPGRKGEHGAQGEPGQQVNYVK